MMDQPIVSVRDFRKTYGGRRRRRHQLRGAAAARSSACSARTGRQDDHPGVPGGVCARPTAALASWASTRPRARKLRNLIGVQLQTSRAARRHARR